MSAGQPDGGKGDAAMIEALLPTLSRNATTEPTMPFVELTRTTMAATTAWPFSTEPEQIVENPPPDEPEPPVFTQDDLDAARAAGFDAGLQAAEETCRQATAAHEEALEKQREQGFASGYEQGFSKGTEAGHSEGLREQRVQFQDRQRLLVSLVEQLENHVSSVDEQLTESVIQLVSSLTRELVQAELCLQPDTVRRVIRHAAGLLPRYSSHLRIFVHPEELPGLEGLEVGQDLPFELIADASQERGGCRLLCDQVEIDAGLAERLNRYLDVVRQELREGRGHGNV